MSKYANLAKATGWRKWVVAILFGAMALGALLKILQFETWYALVVLIIPAAWATWMIWDSQRDHLL